jgi:flagellar biosynthesis protein FlhF
MHKSIEKVFTGATMAEAMERVKIELGEDAVIVESKHVSKGVVEVRAVVQHSEDEPSTATSLKDQVTAERTNEKGIPSPVQTRASQLAEAVSTLVEKGGLGRFLAERILSRWPETQGSFSEKLEVILQKSIIVDEQLSFSNRFVAIMGSSGSGKTSIAFKLAQQLTASCGIQCGVLHLDTSHRPILNVSPEGLSIPIVSYPLHECYPATLGRCLNEFAECDLVFIDLPLIGGLGDEASSAQCARLMALLKSVEILVALDCRLQLQVLRHSIRQVKTFGDTRAVLTRVDEGGSMGAALSLLFEIKCPLAFISTGPRIPEDIEPASYSRCAWMLAKYLIAEGIDSHVLNNLVKIKKGTATEENDIFYESGDSKKGSHEIIQKLAFSEFV